MRYDEEFAMHRFIAYLSREIDATKITWEDGDDPPDFDLFVSGTKFAVEVTTLMEMVDLGSEVKERRQIDGSRMKLLKEVERQAQSERFLNGTYIVSFGLPNDEFRSQRPIMKKFLLDYIRRTQLETSPAQEVLKPNRLQYCSIQKGAKPGSRVIVGGFPVTSQWEIDANQKMCRMLTEAIKDKSFELGLPKILLLLDENHFIDSTHLQECNIDTGLLGSFHLIFVVNPYGAEDQDFVLYYAGAGWGE